MAVKDHEYTASIIWDGNTGEGTASYSGYGREYRVLVAGKPALSGSADPAYHGDPAKHNPEDLFVASIAACHMLFYLALCAKKGIRVLEYRDDAHGRLVIGADGRGAFEEITLHPGVLIDDENQIELATQLHEGAHARCFIANSCSVPIRHSVTVKAKPMAR